MNFLIVIDMQNDFISGALGTKEAQEIVPAVKEKIAQCQSSQTVIFYTRDTHGTDYLHTQEGRKLPVSHCIKGTDGWEIAEGIYAEGTAVIDKPSFGSLELPERIRESLSNGEVAGKIELIGLCTDICVISNAMILKAAFPEASIVVDSSCCAGVSVESHQRALDAMEMCQIEVR